MINFGVKWNKIINWFGQFRDLDKIYRIEAGEDF